MEKSLNQIRVELKDVATAHAQLNSFFWGDLTRAWNENNLNYPLLCSYTKGSGHQFLNNQTQIQLIIIVADKQFEDWNENLNEVESDTLQILRDVFNVINKSPRWNKLGKFQTGVVTKFIDDTGDGLTGHTLELTFLLRDQSGYCDTPIFGYDFENGDEGEGCPQARVINSDLTFDEMVNSGSILELPDITITDSDGTDIQWPSAKNFVCSPPSGGSSGLLPLKTGQTISYRSNDDGDIEAGRSVDFFTLNFNNPFGNTTRFTDELGGQTYTNNIVVDWSTYDGTNVLMWDRRVNGGNANVDKNWNSAIDEAAAHSVGTYTSGWRLPNRMEAMTICYDGATWLNYTPFGYTASQGFWMSNTRAISTGQACFFFPTNNSIVNTAKTASGALRWLAVRTGTVTGTTIT